jgi:hypothetical protein
MARKNWRDICRPIIAGVLFFHKDSDEKTIRRALRGMYPFGQRENHPYKIRLDEIKVQLGQKFSGRHKTLESLTGQKSLIET